MKRAIARPLSPLLLLLLASPAIAQMRSPREGRLEQDALCVAAPNLDGSPSSQVEVSIAWDPVFRNSDILVRQGERVDGPYVAELDWTSTYSGASARIYHLKAELGHAPRFLGTLEFRDEDWSKTGIRPGYATFSAHINLREGLVPLSCEFRAPTAAPVPPVVSKRAIQQLSCRNFSNPRRVIELTPDSADFTVFVPGEHPSPSRLRANLTWPKHLGSIAVHTVTDGFRTWIEGDDFRMILKYGVGEKVMTGEVVTNHKPGGFDFNDRYKCE